MFYIFSLFSLVDIVFDDKHVFFFIVKGFPDHFMRREVQAFIVHCTFMDDGCVWRGEVKHLEVIMVLKAKRNFQCRGYNYEAIKELQYYLCGMPGADRVA